MSIFSKTKYKAVLIGTGRIGFSLGLDKKREQPASHTMALLDNKRIELIAGADSNIQTADEWKNYLSQNKIEAKVYYSSTELYANEKPDIIVVAVNENAHLQECISAIKQKPKLVILEKPVALNTQEAEIIRKTAQENEVSVMVNHERRFAFDYIEAKKFLSRIGEIQSVRAELYSGLRVYAPQFEEDGSYSLIHDGTHLVDIVQYLLEIELSNPILTGIYKDKENIIRNFTAHYSTEKIPEIQIAMSGRSKFFAFGIDILGTLGRINIGNGYSKFYERKESKLYSGFYSLTNAKVKLPKKTGYFSNMIQNAVNFLDKKANLLSPLEDAIQDLKVLEEIKEKLKF